MEQGTVMALSVASVLTPWVVEVLKMISPMDMRDRKALTLTVVVSLMVAVGVLWHQGQLDWSNPSSLMLSAAAVLGVSSAVYKYLRRAVQKPVESTKMRIDAMMKR